MRAVFDPNVLISALLSSSGKPAELIRRWTRGEFELIVSPVLLEELERALSYPKIALRLEARDVGLFLAWIGDEAESAADPSDPAPIQSEDSGDDYLIALSMVEGAALVSGDKHLLALSGELPIYRPADFLEILEEVGRSGS